MGATFLARRIKSFPPWQLSPSHQAPFTLGDSFLGAYVKNVEAAPFSDIVFSPIFGACPLEKGENTCFKHIKAPTHPISHLMHLGIVMCLALGHVIGYVKS